MHISKNSIYIYNLAQSRVGAFDDILFGFILIYSYVFEAPRGCHGAMVYGEKKNPQNSKTFVIFLFCLSFCQKPYLEHSSDVETLAFTSSIILDIHFNSKFQTICLQEVKNRPKFAKYLLCLTLYV